MEQTTINSAPAGRSAKPWEKIGLIVLVTAVIAAGGFLAYYMISPIIGAGGPAESGTITAEQLAADHGLGIRLIGVTAGGGMIDFRLKILDAEKAQQFLEDPANLPKLIVADSGYELMPSEGLDDDIEWSDGGVLFSFYPNDEGAVKPGTAVIIQFGDVQLEPQIAQ